MTQAVNVPGVGTLNFPDGMSQQDMAAAIQKNFPQIHQKPPESAMMTQGKRLLGGLAGDTNAFIQGAAAIPAGIAGLGGAAYGAIKGALDPNDTASNAAANASQSAMQAVQNYTPQINPSDPSIREGQQAAQQGIGAVMGALPALAEKGIDLADKGAAKILPQSMQGGLARANAALQGLGNIGANVFGPSAVMKIPGVMKGVNIPTAIPEATPFKLARDAGYSIMPSEAAIKGGSAPIGKLVEGLAGSAKTGVDATVKNQAVTNRLAAQEIGVKPGTPLTDSVLAAARQPHNAVYQEVQSLSGPYGKIQPDGQFYQELNSLRGETANDILGQNPDIQNLLDRLSSRKTFSTEDIVKSVKSLRQNARSNYKASNAMQAKNAYDMGELADAQQGAADALENQLDRFVQNIPGKEDLVTRWRNARQSLAKINSVDNAIKEGTTDVSAPALAKQMNKGAPLSGNLKTVADAANAFPISVRDIGAVRNKVPINALEGLMGTGGIGAALIGEPHAAAALGTGMVARPLARAGLLSNPVQQGMLPGQISPELLKLIAPATAQALFTGNQK